jgi:hypothetical protein
MSSGDRVMASGDRAMASGDGIGRSAMPSRDRRCDHPIPDHPITDHPMG